MITIPEVVDEIIKKSPFLEEALSQKIVNLSALARQIKEEVERQVMKKVQEGAIIMALKRLSLRLEVRMKSQQKLFTNVPELMVRSHLMELTLANSVQLIEKQKKLLKEIKTEQNYFINFTHGIFETTIIASKDLKNIILTILKGEKLISQFDNLASISIQLPKSTVMVPGAYSYILKALVWGGINVIEVVSTCHEFTLIFEEKDIVSSFSILKQLFQS